MLTFHKADQRQRFPVTAHIVLQDNQHVFLLRRANTGYEDGNYSLVAGHLDGGESVMQAAIRETREEAGVQVAPTDLKINFILHRMSDEERFDFILTATSW
ncbi:MAG: NUDIX domain-containing protein, partial [candidate division Zixibacteria bacterium]|nr:NUDIX domain-containing protein [candidate division Zixibacteria bacterium]NIR67010.1 NUDIX domain-containing protein [candidate division Zixibacteria bacterium]NIS48990.1 NUDIX domain-containing protein [candidate division Zixibacteria bacterium]NIU16548.1 NUDIX domain-containing protein [candidate division Zixibacteria bacterium]NIV08676.1 NUDIX domain-containing protein [candidate division Zixibacteria bacterium]